MHGGGARRRRGFRVPLEPSTAWATLSGLALSLLGVEPKAVLHSSASSTTVAVEGTGPVTLAHAVDPASLQRTLVVDAWDDHVFASIHAALSGLAYSPPSASPTADAASAVTAAPDDDYIKATLDGEYLALLKEVMAQRLASELAAVAQPLEEQARASEGLVNKVKSLLVAAYNKHNVPLPVLLPAPPLDSFALDKVPEPVLYLSSATASPAECDAELKRSMVRTSEAVKLARTKRKQAEVAARERVSQSNCEALVRPLLALSSAAGVTTTTVNFVLLSVVLSGTPGTLYVTAKEVVFEPWRFSSGPRRVEWRIKEDIVGLDLRAAMVGLVETCALKPARASTVPPTEFTLLPGSDQGRALQKVIEILVAIQV